MRKIICSPGEYVQGKGEMKRLADYYASADKKGVYMIVDPFFTTEDYQAMITGSFKAANIPYTFNPFGGECSTPEIEKHQKQLSTADTIIGIGGGKTLDTAKTVAHYAGLPVIIVPTAASTDAPCSRLSVVYTEDGVFDHYLPLPKNPDCVVMDTDVIAKAPARFLMAGIGDALATCYEAEACERSRAVTLTGGHSTRTAMTLARLCRQILFEDGEKAKLAVEAGVHSEAVENIVEANTYLSGVGFESGGLAAAHAIHDGMTVLPETHGFLHGEKVAFGTIVQMVLENKPLEELSKVIRFCKKLGLPTCFSDLGIQGISDAQLMAAAEASCDENDTMGNMPFPVALEDVAAAMKVADRLSATL